MHHENGGTLHVLPALPYAHAALEPHIDARTMTLHHGKHHASYVDNLNAALADCPELQHRSALWLLLNAGEIPVAARTAVRNNAGGHLNHSLLWRAMSPSGGGEPTGALADAIKRDFGSFTQFKARFAEAGNKVFGSGWVWLARAQRDGGKLLVSTTSGHENPLTQGQFPVLVNDVWEHAYYLKHENRRLDYLNAWWAIADWDEAARRYEMSGNAAAQSWKYEDGRTLAPAGP
ncbi:MAG TPA: superoxide dismutase [Burkholderiales bacterium]